MSLQDLHNFLPTLLNLIPLPNRQHHPPVLLHFKSQYSVQSTLTRQTRPEQSHSDARRNAGTARTLDARVKPGCAFTHVRGHCRPASMD